MAEKLALADESDIAARCRVAAQMHFDLSTVGCTRYLNVYPPSRRLTLLGIGKLVDESTGSRLLPIEAASTRYRVAQFIEPLAEKGITMTIPVSRFAVACSLVHIARHGRARRLV